MGPSRACSQWVVRTLSNLAGREMPMLSPYTVRVWPYSRMVIVISRSYSLACPPRSTASGVAGEPLPANVHYWTRRVDMDCSAAYSSIRGLEHPPPLSRALLCTVHYTHLVQRACAAPRYAGRAIRPVVGRRGVGGTTRRDMSGTTRTHVERHRCTTRTTRSVDVDVSTLRPGCRFSRISNSRTKIIGHRM